MVKKTLQQVAAIKKAKQNKNISQKVASSGNLPSSYIPRLLHEEDLTEKEYKIFLKLKEAGNTRKQALNSIYFMRDLKD